MSFTKDRSFYISARWQAYRADDDQMFQSGNVLKILRTRIGDTNPHWRDQVRDQQNATTNMTGIHDSVEMTRSNSAVLHKNRLSSTDSTIYRSWTKGDFVLPQLADWSIGITETEANNRALIAFLKNVRQAQVQFSAPTFLGELRETMKMIRSPAKGLMDLAKTWQKKQPRDIFRDRHTKNGSHRYHAWKQNLSSAWLEQAFGWQPLINDISTAFRTYTGLRDRKSQVPVSGYGIEKKQFPARTFSNQGVVFSNNTRYTYNQVATEECFIKYHGMVTQTIDGSLVNKLEPFGFSISEFVPTAWELLPWSFLIDYFSNIGDVITCGVANRASLAWVNRSRSFIQRQQRSGGFDLAGTKALWAPGKFISGFGTPLAMLATRRTVKRDRGYAVGYPTLSFELPGLPTQWANMTALFAQMNNTIHPQRRH
jgi:hypothetical protein